jgi:hypothetical protein
MNWLRENPFLSGVILVFVVGVGVLGFFISGAATALDESTQAYTAAVQKLHQLQNRVPFPNQANLDKTEELRRQFEAELDALRARLRTMQQPVQENIAPQQFQDELRQRVNALTAKAQAAKVGLPENFYLGFDNYRDTLPSQRATPYLARQLAFISGIIESLIGPNPENPGVRSIDALTRPTLPEEGTAPEPKDKPAVRREPFLLTFTAEQGKFRIALNSLLKTDTFLIVRNLMVENSKQDGPPVQAEGAAPADDTQLSSLFGTSNEAPQSGSSLDVILGRELLTIRAMIEMIEFNLPPGAEEQSEAAE